MIEILNASIVEMIQDQYGIPDLDSVLSFIDRHPYVVPVLLEAGIRIRGLFPDATLSLDRIVDPDAATAETAEGLALAIFTALPPREAMDLLRNLERSWWISRPYEVLRSMYLDLEFV